MKKLFAAFLFLICSTAFAVDMYNAIATAYVTTTISQKVVFDSAMQSGGTFNFSVLAHNGGGRAGQSDTANVKIQFYTAGGALVSTVNNSYSNNLPNPNAVCGNPCIDPAVPWTTLSISSTLSSAQASTVAYAAISMYGIDGSYWAGDYGPWYRAPTFTFNDGANLAYNPEFGPYNNITAQGWTSSPGFGACQGAWGGSNACIVNSSGQPGTSTAGLVANQNGGGPSATGGTTSGQPGGYNSTMTTSNAAGAPPKTVVSTSVTYTTSTTTSGNTTSTYRTPVTTTNWSDGTTSTSNGTRSLYTTTVVDNQIREIIIGNNIYKFTIITTTTSYADGSGSTVTKSLYTEGDMNVAAAGQIYAQIFQGNTNATNWADLQNVQAGTSWYCPSCAVTSGTVVSVSSDGAGSLYFYLVDQFGNPVTTDSGQYYIFTNITPVIRPAFDGTLTQTNNPPNQTITSGGGSSAGITTDQQSRVDTWHNSVQGTGNEIKLDVNGSGNTLYIEQVGNSNVVQGNGGDTATVYGNSNNIKINQGTSGTGQNLIKMDVTGDNNNFDIKQARDDNGIPVGTNGHYQSITINGTSNVLNTQQSNTTLGSQYSETTINGNQNSVITKQTDNGNKVMFTTVTGNNNTVSATQSGTGQHTLTTNLTGNGNSATVNQSGNLANNANIDLTNAGGAATLDLIQSGGKNFTIQQMCVNPAGCSTTVRQ